MSNPPPPNPSNLPPILAEILDQVEQICAKANHISPETTAVENFLRRHRVQKAIKKEASRG